jgi:hypothetical protein
MFKSTFGTFGCEFLEGASGWRQEAFFCGKQRLDLSPLAPLADLETMLMLQLRATTVRPTDI